MIALKSRKKWIAYSCGMAIIFTGIFLQSRVYGNPSNSDQIFASFQSFFSQREYDATNSCDEATPTHDHNSHVHAGSIPQQGRFLDCVWPPQPKFLSNVTNHSNAFTAGRSPVDDTTTQAAFNDPAVRALLGNRYVHIKTTDIETKWESGSTQTQVTYFSYSNNETIRAIVEGSQVVSIEQLAPQDFQPPLRQSEVEWADTIAREYWANLGEEIVNDLEGYTILTHPDDNSALYYDTRVVYVSYHKDSISKPVLLTWVDLTTETVLRGSYSEAAGGK